jgi:hypothetical protein
MMGAQIIIDVDHEIEIASQRQGLVHPMRPNWAQNREARGIPFVISEILNSFWNLTVIEFDMRIPPADTSDPSPLDVCSRISVVVGLIWRQMDSGG